MGPLLAGNLGLLGICFYKKAWTEKAFEDRYYQALYLILPYFFAASVGLIYYILSNDDAFSAMQLVALSLLTMVNLGTKLTPIEKTLDLLYRLAWAISVVALLVLFAYESGGSGIPNHVLIGFLALGGVLAWSYNCLLYTSPSPRD